MKRTSGCLFLRVVWLVLLLETAMLAIPARAKTRTYVANSASRSVSVRHGDQPRDYHRSRWTLPRGGSDRTTATCIFLMG